MISQNELKLKVKALKAFHNINYKELSEKLGIKPKSFYGWLKGDFNLSEANQIKLNNILTNYEVE